MGYVNRNGDLDLNIRLRTLWQRCAGLKLESGAGIVADSIAEPELLLPDPRQAKGHAADPEP